MSCHLTTFPIDFSPPYRTLSNSKRYVKSYQPFIHTSKQSSNEQPVNLFKQATKQGRRTIKIRSRVVIVFYWSDWSVEICYNFCVLLNSCSRQRVSQINPLIHLPQYPKSTSCRCFMENSESIQPRASNVTLLARNVFTAVCVSSLLDLGARKRSHKPQIEVGWEDRGRWDKERKSKKGSLRNMSMYFLVFWWDFGMLKV